MRPGEAAAERVSPRFGLPLSTDGLFDGRLTLDKLLIRGRPSSGVIPHSETRSTRRGLLLTGAGLSAAALAGCFDESTPDDSQASDGDGTVPGSWPQFGVGPQNTGYDPTVSGPGAGDPALAWRDDAGTPTMNASPVVADGTVYVPGSGDPGPINAVDAETGEQVWQFEPAGYASSAPALADGTLYVGTWGRRFYAVDAKDGEERWHREIGHLFSSSSPAVVDGTVYVGTAGDSPAVVGGPGDQRPFKAPTFLALDAATGETRWRYDDFGRKDGIYSSPAVADGRVYFGAEGVVHALDAEAGEVVWTRTVPTHADSSPAIADGVVYHAGPADAGPETPAAVRAMDAATGETLWTAGADDMSPRTSPAIADGTVYVAANVDAACPAGDDSGCYGKSQGRLYALDAASGERRWTIEIALDTRSSPAVAGGVVYVGCGDGLSAVTVDGERAWRVNFKSDDSDDDDGPYVKSSPAVADGRVFVGASDGRLRAIGAAGSG